MALNRYGTIFFSIDGTPHQIEGDVEFTPAADAGEAVTGPDRSVGVKITPEPARLKVNARDRGDLDVSQLRGMDGVTLTLQLSNGKAWSMPDAVQISAEAINLMDGNIPLEFIAETSDEI
jgi:hypothetical protein